MKKLDMMTKHAQTMYADKMKEMSEKMSQEDMMKIMTAAIKEE